MSGETRFLGNKVHGLIGGLVQKKKNDPMFSQNCLIFCFYPRTDRDRRVVIIYSMAKRNSRRKLRDLGSLCVKMVN